MSLNIGADDFISKPYNAQVLLARIQKLLARTYEIQDNVVLTHKGLTLNLLKAEISYQFIDENTLNVNIVRLRKTLAEIGLPDYLETKRGLGYCV